MCPWMVLSTRPVELANTLARAVCIEYTGLTVAKQAEPYHALLQAFPVKGAIAVVFEEAVKKLCLVNLPAFKSQPGLRMLDCKQLFQGHLEKLWHLGEEGIPDNRVL